MKYIIDDSDICSVLVAYDENEAQDIFDSLTPVPELPVKPWQERTLKHGLAIHNMPAIEAEITELRALCQAQASEIERITSPKV